MGTPRAISVVVLAGTLFASGPALAGEPSIWTPAVRKQIVGEALKVAPPSLARLLIRHSDSLMAGLEAAEADGFHPQHNQVTDRAHESAAASLALTSRWAASAMEGHQPIAAMVYRMGVVAHYAMDLSDPVKTAPEAAQAPFAVDYALYLQRNVSRFPVVFYGYPEPAAGPGGDPGTAHAVPPTHEDLQLEGLRAAEESRVYYAHLARAYEKAGGTSRKFDVRSIPFGVASISYSRAVTNVARSWLGAWRTARGDLTGTPHLKGAPPLPDLFKIESRPQPRRAPTIPAGTLTTVSPEPDPPPAAAAVSPPEEGKARLEKTIYGKAKSGRPPTGKATAGTEAGSADESRED